MLILNFLCRTSTVCNLIFCVQDGRIIAQQKIKNSALYIRSNMFSGSLQVLSAFHYRRMLE